MKIAHDTRLVVITGSAGGIGEKIRDVFRASGFYVIGVDLVLSSCDKDFVGDVRDKNLIESVIDFVASQNSSFLVLVNNAGVTIPNDDSLEAWEKTLGINLTAPFLWMSSFGNYFESSKSKGSIINITSLGAELAFPNNPAYLASKGGLKQLTKSFALRLGPTGVTCNNVGPGYIETDFNSGSLNNPEAFKERADRSMLNRWGSAGEIAAAVGFLASENARFITGQDIYVDGGWLAKGFS